jgi:hypothetical protein
MRTIVVRRWLGSGLAAGALIFVCEGALGRLYLSDIQALLAEHRMVMVMDATAWIISVCVSLIIGLTIMFFYATARTRFGPGPITAIKVGVALWIGGYAVSLLGYKLIGLFPDKLLTIWGIAGLVEMMLAALVGGWLYRES